MKLTIEQQRLIVRALNSYVDSALRHVADRIHSAPDRVRHELHHGDVRAFIDDATAAHDLAKLLDDAVMDQRASFSEHEGVTLERPATINSGNQA